jgi:hypothetical protein
MFGRRIWLSMQEVRIWFTSHFLMPAGMTLCSHFWWFWSYKTDRIIRRRLHANVFLSPASWASTTTTSTHTSFCSIEQEAQSSHGKQKCYCLHGKFDVIQTIDPFHGLVVAFNGFCKQLVEGKLHRRAHMTEAIGEWPFTSCDQPLMSKRYPHFLKALSFRRALKNWIGCSRPPFLKGCYKTALALSILSSTMLASNKPIMIWYLLERLAKTFVNNLQVSAQSITFKACLLSLARG